MLYRHSFDFDNDQFRLVLRGDLEKHKVAVHAFFTDFMPKVFTGKSDGISGTKLCFESLYVGSNGLSYSESSPDPHALGAFREYFLKRSYEKAEAASSRKKTKQGNPCF